MDINFENIEKWKELLDNLNSVLKYGDFLDEIMINGGIVSEEDDLTIYNLNKVRDLLDKEIENYEKVRKININPRIKKGSAFYWKCGKKEEYFKIDKVDLEAHHIQVTCIYFEKNYYQVVQSDHDIEVYNKIFEKYSEIIDIDEEEWARIYGISETINNECM